MLVCFAFEAAPGREAEMEALLNDPEMARRVARALGATRNTLFVGGGRMVRVLEFPEGARPRPIAEAAAADPAIADFLRRLGPLVRDGFDLDRPQTLDAFNRRVMVPFAFDVRP